MNEYRMAHFLWPIQCS